MQNRLQEMEERFERIGYMLTQPEIFSDSEKLRSLLQEQKSLTPAVEKYREYKACREESEALQSELKGIRPEEDKELLLYVKDELSALKIKSEALEEELRILLLPKDPDDDKSIVVEIRAGAGGEEAALFAADLCRMYSMYATSAGLRFTVTSDSPTELGGYKEVSFLIEGEGAYGRFKFESGVHRVQRVPETESQGRIQTSTVTVAVLPEAESVEVEIGPGDIEIETCKSSGAGGQHINKTESAVRLIHRPSGIVVECRSERSQLQNKEQAMKILRSKLYEIESRKQHEKIASERKSQVGSGDRSEKIRTYNYPQGRVTDHRIGLSLYSLDNFLDGDIAEMLDALAAADAAEKMKAEGAVL